MADFAAFHLDDALVVYGRPVLPVALDRMCRVHWRYISVDGTPVVGRLTVFGNIQTPYLDVSGILVGDRVEALTDSGGRGEAYLLRGMECEVVINETHITRRITIPDDEVALLDDLVAAAPDAFSVQRAVPTTLIRRSI